MREIDAHLRAAERNELKRSQHLIAATQHADANKVPHFGRWSEQQITRRAWVYAERIRERAAKDHGTRRQEESSQQRSNPARESAQAQLAAPGKAEATSG